MEGFELILFQIITNVGAAKSAYMDAIACAEEGDYDQAENVMKEGKELYLKGHHVHAELIQKEAAGEPTETSLLLIHAEDQLMITECISALAEQMLKLYRKVNVHQEK